MIASAPLWAVLVVAALLTVFTVVAVAADALLGAWAAGRRVTGAALTAPLVEVLRLLAAQPRTTPAADGLLWRLGLAVVPVAGVLSAVVIPFGDVTVSPMTVGVVWFNAMEVLTWAGAVAGGLGAERRAKPCWRVPVRGAGPGL